VREMGMRPMAGRLGKMASWDQMHGGGLPGTKHGGDKG
jgi:hypothetical protein